jgi:segregation and condensation protein B
MDRGVDKGTVRLIESLLFLENGPVNIDYIARLSKREKTEIRAAIDLLRDRLEETESALIVVENEKGDYQLSVAPELYEKLGEYYDSRKKLSFSPQALETLAIVAYKQPVTRAEIERIRGVAVGHVLRILLEHDMIRISGRKNAPGRPALYSTTNNFLKFFGLLSLKDLPNLSEFERG